MNRYIWLISVWLITHICSGAEIVPHENLPTIDSIYGSVPPLFNLEAGVLEAGVSLPANNSFTEATAMIEKDASPTEAIPAMVIAKHLSTKRTHSEREDGDTIDDSITSRKKSRTTVKPTHKKFVCHVCHKEFRWKCRLEDHANLHSNNRFQCDIEGCNREFAWKSNLLAHKKLHTGDIFRCDIEGCDKVFVLKGDLTAHKRSHTREILQCDIDGCGKVFTKNSKLKRHQITHLALLPACPCIYCGKHLANKDSLAQHEKACKLK